MPRRCVFLIEDGRATGIAYRRAGRDETVRANAEVILAAGAVQTPQLLELSGIGDGKLLSRHGIGVVLEAPGVGENYQDHYATRMKLARHAADHPERADARLAARSRGSGISAATTGASSPSRPGSRMASYARARNARRRMSSISSCMQVTPTRRIASSIASPA